MACALTEAAGSGVAGGAAGRGPVRCSGGSGFDSAVHTPFTAALPPAPAPAPAPASGAPVSALAVAAAPVQLQRLGRGGSAAAALAPGLAGRAEGHHRHRGPRHRRPIRLCEEEAPAMLAENAPLSLPKDPKARPCPLSLQADQRPKLARAWPSPRLPPLCPCAHRPPSLLSSLPLRRLSRSVARVQPL